VNTLFWGLGILLFFLCFNKYKQFIGKQYTLHSFLGETYGPSVRIVASYLTIIAFLGYAIAETYFGSKVLLSIIDNKLVFYTIISVSILFVYGYIAYGGQVSSIRTDQLQLIFSYVGIFGVMIYFIYLIISNGILISPVLSWSFISLSLYIILILYIRKLVFIKLSEDDTRSDRFLNIPLNYLVNIAFSTLAILALIAFLSSKQNQLSMNLFNVEGFGVPGLLSLIILPLFFQFVDLTNWQRILAVKPDQGPSANSLEKNIRKGLLTYAVESPFTWLIFIFFGLLTITALPQFTFKDLLIDIPKQLINSNIPLQIILGYTFMVSIVAIMLSTVDSLIMGIIFTFVYDSHPRTRKLIDGRNETDIKNNYKNIISIGRIFGFVAIVIGLLLFIVFDNKVKNGGELFINLLLAFYSAQLSFLPLIFGILFLKKHPSTFWANLSMIIGALFGVGIGIYAVIADPQWAWYPIIICFILSSTIYLFGYLFRNDNINSKLCSLWNICIDHRNQRFSKVILSFIAMLIIIFSIYFLSFKKDFLSGCRIWELASYIFTFIYTLWFWFWSENGGKLCDNIGGRRIIKRIVPALFGIFIISIIHLIVAINSNILGSFIEYYVNISLLLLVGVYFIFLKINKLIKDSNSNRNTKEIKTELTSTADIIDTSAYYIFGILFIYSIFIYATGNIKPMEIFFSGAIAFELLLSGIIWTSTNVA
jgi:hypothetical protein